MRASSTKNCTSAARQPRIPSTSGPAGPPAATTAACTGVLGPPNASAGSTSTRAAAIASPARIRPAAAVTPTAETTSVSTRVRAKSARPRASRDSTVRPAAISAETTSTYWVSQATYPPARPGATRSPAVGVGVCTHIVSTLACISHHASNTAWANWPTAAPAIEVAAALATPATGPPTTAAAAAQPAAPRPGTAHRSTAGTTAAITAGPTARRSRPPAGRACPSPARRRTATSRRPATPP